MEDREWDPVQMSGVTGCGHRGTPVEVGLELKGFATENHCLSRVLGKEDRDLWELEPLYTSPHTDVSSGDVECRPGHPTLKADLKFMNPK